MFDSVIALMHHSKPSPSIDFISSTISLFAYKYTSIWKSHSLNTIRQVFDTSVEFKILWEYMIEEIKYWKMSRLV